METLDVMHVAATEMRNSIIGIMGLEALLTWSLAALNVLKPVTLATHTIMIICLAVADSQRMRNGDHVTQ